MKRYNSFLLIIICLGLCCGLFLNYQRSRVEGVNRTVETVMDFDAVVRLAQQEGISRERAFALFKERGVDSLALYDYSLQSLEEQGAIVMATGAELQRESMLGHLSPAWSAIVGVKDFNPNAVYVGEGSVPEAMKDIREDIALRLGKERCKVVSTSPQVLRITGDIALIKDNSKPGEQIGIREMPLGISSAELKLAKKLGFMVVARPSNYTAPVCATSAAPKAQIDNFLQRLARSGALVSGINPEGKEVLGLPGGMQYLAEQLQQRKINLYMTEGVTQLQFVPTEGLTELARLMDYRVVRCYTIHKLELKKLSFYNAQRRWSLSDEERNIRVNHITTFLTPRDNKTLLQTNLDYVKQIVDSVRGRGFVSGRAVPFAPYFPSRICLGVVALAIMAGVVLYLAQLISVSARLQNIAWAVLGLAAAVPVVLKGTLVVRQGLAILAAVVFPVLALHFIYRRWESRQEAGSLASVLLTATVSIVICVLLSLIGACFLSAILGDIRFFLEIDIYRGVKLTFLLPLFLMLLLFFKEHALWEGDDAFSNLLLRLQVLLQKPLTAKTIAGLGVLGIVAIIFIGRSGHSAGLAVPALELKMRYFLEQVMFARPRSKEFLIGHPCFYLAAWAALSRFHSLFYLLVILGATIGQASLVQTFAHMRTPVLMSYVRAVDGMVLGIVLGIVVLIIFSGAYSFWLDRRKEQAL